MKKLIFMVILLVTALCFGQEVFDSPGPHWLWEDELLEAGVTKVSTPLYTGHWPYAGLWIKTTNPADSTKYRVSFKGAYELTDTFAIASDSSGNDVGTIIRISDTLWHYCSIKSALAPYTKIYIEADALEHGNRANISIKAFLWRNNYWQE
ncbi:MAG: hypothetical protein WBB37_07655 [bacterium]